MSSFPPLLVARWTSCPLSPLPVLGAAACSLHAPSVPAGSLPRFSTVEPGGLLLYNGRLNERHDFLAVEIIQGQVQLKYSTGRLGTTYCGIWAMGAAKRGGFCCCRSP